MNIKFSKEISIVSYFDTIFQPIYDRHVSVSRVSSTAHDSLPHNWIHYSTPSYKLSLLSLQEKSFTSQWPSSALNPQRDIPNRESTEMSPGRIKRERVTIELSQEWVKWPKAYRKLYDRNEKTQHNSVPSTESEFVWQREKESVHLFKCLHCKANLLNECSPLFCPGDGPPRALPALSPCLRTTQESLSGRYSGIVWGSEVHAISELLDWILGRSLLSSLE